MWERGGVIHIAPESPQKKQMFLHPNEIKKTSSAITACSAVVVACQVESTIRFFFGIQNLRMGDPRQETYARKHTENSQSNQQRSEIRTIPCINLTTQAGFSQITSHSRVAFPPQKLIGKSLEGPKVEGTNKT